MKKVLALMLTSILTLSLVACGNDGQDKGSDGKAGDGADSKPSGTVVVYSPHDADPLNAGINMFMDAYPDVEVEIVAAGTGELLNRISAESENPIADVIWGGGADSLAAYKEYFAPYVSSNDEFIDDAYKDAEDLWIGESPLPMVLFYNKTLIEEAGMEIPTSFDDLTDSQWKGKIAYVLPSKSGSAFTQLVTMLFGHGGTEKGWDMVEKLYANLDGKILDSSSKAHKMVADGEFFVGITLEKAAVQYKDNAAVGFVYPEDGTSAVPDGISLIKNAPNEDNAKLFIDYVTSKEFQEAQNKEWGRRPVRSDVTPVGLPALSEIELVDYDFDWAAKNKEAVIERFNEIMVGE